MQSTADSPKEGTPCLNCGAALQGAYCHACGQKGGGPPLYFHDFVHELVHEFLHFDSKIWRTLKLLMFSPGTLTRECVVGRRARYVGPVRLFLVTSLVLFGLLAFTKAHVVGEGGVDATDEAEVALERDEDAAESHGDRIGLTVLRAAKKAVRDPEHLQAAFLKALSKSVFLLVPMFAWVTWRLFVKEQGFYVAHMYFALHFHAFAFVLLSVLTMLALSHVPSNGVLEALVGVAILAYFYAALRRALDASWPRVLLRGSLVLLVCSALNGIVILSLFVGTLLLL